MPDTFGFGMWRKYIHNAIEGAVGWLNGGDQVDSAEWWMDEDQPQRKVEDF